MERDVFGKKAYKPRKYFNSHAHVERDAKNYKKLSVNVISTHTLTWSVTENVLKKYNMRKISTHTLTWSVTPRLLYVIL